MCLGTLKDKVDILHATWQVRKNDIKRGGMEVGTGTWSVPGKGNALYAYLGQDNALFQEPAWSGTQGRDTSLCQKENINFDQIVSERVSRKQSLLWPRSGLWVQ